MTKKFDFEGLIREVCASGQFATNFDAIEAVRSTLRTISECVPGAIANEVAASLPALLADSARCETWSIGERLSDTEFAYRLALRERTSIVIAKRHAVLILSALAALLPDDLVVRLRNELPYNEAIALAHEPPPECAHMHQGVQTLP